jgi:hypothetical protein
MKLVEDVESSNIISWFIMDRIRSIRKQSGFTFWNLHNPTYWIVNGDTRKRTHALTVIKICPGLIDFIRETLIYRLMFSSRSENFDFIFQNDFSWRYTAPPKNHERTPPNPTDTHNTVTSDRFAGNGQGHCEF